MRAEEKRLFVAALLLGLLLSRALRALLTTLFFESLETLRLNESAGWTLVLLAPAAAPLAARAPRAVLLVGGLTSAALGFARFTDAYIPLAALALAALLAAAPLLALGIGGLLAGIALDATLLVAGHGHDPTLGLLGSITVLLAALGMSASAPRATTVREGGLFAGLALGALLALEWTFLASPYAAARWAELPVWVAASASLLGLVVGATRLRRAKAWLWVAGGLGLLDVALLGSPVVALSLAFAQAALGASAVRLAPLLAGRMGGAGLALALAPLLFVLLFFRAPLGLGEWSILVPVLALVPLLGSRRVAAREGGSHVPGGAVAAVLVLILLMTAATPARLDDPPAGRELTIVTWNVHQAFGNRGALDPHVYASVLERLDADVILLQESDTARLSSGGLDVVLYLADRLGMHAAYGLVGPAILSRAPFVAPTLETAEWSLETAIELDGERVALQSVHFARSSEAREAQARTLAAVPAGLRIAGGDFNLFGGLDQGPYGTLTTRYQDTWVAAGNAIDDPAGATFRLPEVRRRIDIVFVDGLETLSAQRVLDGETRLASDHLPVIVRLRLPVE